MKTKDLMIGDFVHSKLHDIDTFVIDVEGRVLKDQPKLEYTEAVSIWLDGEQCWERHFMDEIDPIALTPAFLAKNGFTLVDPQDKTYRLEFAEGIYIQADFKGSEPCVYVSNRSFFACPICLYVHELQHAMRVCGIEMKLKI